MTSCGTSAREADRADLWAITVRLRNIGQRLSSGMTEKQHLTGFLKGGIMLHNCCKFFRTIADTRRTQIQSMGVCDARIRNF